MSDFDNAVLKVSGVLAIKMMVTHLLTVRNRLMTSNLVFKAQTDVLDEDKAIGQEGTIAYYSLLPMRALLACVGPSLSHDRLQGSVRNNYENEPYFLAVVAALARKGGNDETLAQIVYAYGAARVIHTLAYLFGLPQPTRAFSFTAGTGCTLYLAQKLVL